LYWFRESSTQQPVIIEVTRLFMGTEVRYLGRKKVDSLDSLRGLFCGPLVPPELGADEHDERMRNFDESNQVWID
jgi:hypothetical protein